MKIVCIYHSIDLDGWMSAAIVKHWFTTNKDKENKETKQLRDRGILVSVELNHLEFIGYNYGDPIPDLSEYDKVIMCDISFPKEEMLAINKRLGENFVWIDHHQRTINEVNQYIIDNGIPMEGLVTEEGELMAACELTWKYFLFHNDPMPEIVRLLGRYDCFGHKGTDEEQKVLEFQYGARSCISNYEEAYNYLIDYLNCFKAYPYVILDKIHDIGIAIYQYLCTEAKQAYKNGFPIHFRNDVIRGNVTENGTLTFICINKERFNPINFGIDYHANGYDGAACFHYANDMWNFSLYNDNDEVDCSAIAKQFGGGGHKGAAGFRIKDINQIIK